MTTLRAALLASEDLLDARVGDACGLSDGPLAVALGDGFADGFTPRLFGSGTPRGCAAHTGQDVHLAGGFDGFAQSFDGLRAGGVVQGDGEAKVFGLAAEAVVRLGLTDEIGIGHAARILASGADVKSRPGGSAEPESFEYERRRAA